MRDAFIDELTHLAESDDRIVVLAGDIGNHMFDNFREKFPKRFFNCGIAEANMISVASGMAICGLRPFVYTFSSFDTMRCFEQIRVDLCFQNLPVVIIGLGGGLTYAPLGPTHYNCEDIALMRTLPNMTVVSPADSRELRAVIRESMDHSGPVFIRIGKKKEPDVHKGEIRDFRIGKGIVLNEGSDICIISTGTIIPAVIKTAELLEKKGVSAKVISLHTIKPLDEDLLLNLSGTFSLIVTIEEHSLIGGLGGAIAEWFTDHMPCKARILRLGTDDKFIYTSLDQIHAREFFGLSPGPMSEKIYKTYRSLIYNK